LGERQRLGFKSGTEVGIFSDNGGVHFKTYYSPADLSVNARKGENWAGKPFWLLERQHLGSDNLEIEKLVFDLTS
jgi:hypothetical protein